MSVGAGSGDENGDPNGLYSVVHRTTPVPYFTHSTPSGCGGTGSQLGHQLDMDLRVLLAGAHTASGSESKTPVMPIGKPWKGMTQLFV